MSETRSLPKYVIISPAKDEERYVETTIKAVLGQTVRPARWVIIDDGSSDGTPSILERYRQQLPWLMVVTRAKDQTRQPGSGVIRAFAAGFHLIRDTDFRFIVKLDVDVNLPPDYFEQLVARFLEDETLGIASGIYLQRRGRNWSPVRMPPYHAAGASKMLRAECFAAIGGFVPSRGWDTVDEIKAQALGWKTRHFEDLRFHHLKNEGSGIGGLRTNLMHGEIYYLTGGGKLFFLLKLLHRLFVGEPFLFGAFAMVWGYLRLSASRTPKLVSDSESRVYRQLLNSRIWVGLKRVLERISLRKEAWVHS